jgi:sensor histidine kinase YesM
VSLFFCFTSSVLTALGWAIAMTLLGEEVPWVQFLRTAPSEAWVGFFAVSVFISLVWGWWAWQSWHEEQLKRQTQEAQLRLLQAQIEPHYLFNTLANVRSLIDCDPQQAGELLDAFTDHLRASLNSMRADTVPLGKELELVGHYLKLMQLRMCERLRFSIEADDDARQAMVPPLLLQPLVENAIHHGLECQVEPGHVAVRAKLSKGRLTLTVQDDGVGLNAPSTRTTGVARHGKGNGVATQNIRERLASRYGVDAKFQLAPAPPKGTVATIEMPATINLPANSKAPSLA